MRSSELTVDLSPELSAYLDSVLVHVGVPTSATLTSALEIIQIQFDRALRAVKARINDMAPVNSLPDDVLALIFRAERAPFPSSSAHPAPQVIAAQVCRRWRDVAIFDICCWDNISVNLLRSDCGIALSTLLQRTKSGIVDLTAEETRLRVPDPTVSAGVILPHFDRVRSLSVLVSADRATALFSLLTEPAPHLKSLTIKTTGVSSPVVCAIFLPESVELEYLTLEIITPALDAWKFPLLQHVNISSCIDPVLPSVILSSCPILRSLRLQDRHMYSVDGKPEAEADIAIHTCLEKLELVDLSHTAILNVLRRIHVDALSYIDISCPNIIADSPVAALIFLPRHTEEDLRLRLQPGQFLIEGNSPGKGTKFSGYLDINSTKSMLLAISLTVEDATHLCWDGNAPHQLLDTGIMPHLVDLELRVHSYALLEPLLTPILCPRLESLTITSFVSEEPLSDAVDAITRFIDHGLNFQRPRLRSLILKNISAQSISSLEYALGDKADEVHTRGVTF